MHKISPATEMDPFSYWKTWFEMDHTSTDESSGDEAKPKERIHKRKYMYNKNRQSKSRKIQICHDELTIRREELSLTKIKDTWFNAASTSDWTDDSFDSSFSSSSLTTLSSSSSSSSLSSMTSGYYEGSVSSSQERQFSERMEVDSSDSESYSRNTFLKNTRTDRSEFDLENVNDSVLNKAGTNSLINTASNSVREEIMCHVSQPSNGYDYKWYNTTESSSNFTEMNKPNVIKGDNSKDMNRHNQSHTKLAGRNNRLNRSLHIFQTSSGFGFNRWYHPIQP